MIYRAHAADARIQKPLHVAEVTLVDSEEEEASLCLVSWANYVV